MDTALAYLGAGEALAAYRRLELSPLDVLEAQIERIEAHNGDAATGINAFTETLFDDARVAARRAADTYARCSTPWRWMPGCAHNWPRRCVGTVRAERAGG